MIYNVGSQQQVFLRRAQLKIPLSVRVRTVLCCHFKIRTECLRQVIATNKRGLH
jgi:hypothetical protein